MRRQWWTAGLVAAGLVAQVPAAHAQQRKPSAAKALAHPRPPATIPPLTKPHSYASVERCLTRTGAGPTFARFAPDLSRTLALTAPADVRLHLDDPSGQGYVAHVAALRFDPPDQRVVMSQSEVLSEDPDRPLEFDDLPLTSDVDAYVLDFLPAPGHDELPPERCVLTFGDLWAWASRTTPVSSLGPAEPFTADRIATDAVAARLFAKDGSGPRPVRLRLEPQLAPLRAEQTVWSDRASDDNAPGGLWDGHSPLVPTSDAAYFALKVCSEGTGPIREDGRIATPAVCLVVGHSQLSDTPLVAWSRGAGAALKRSWLLSPALAPAATSTALDALEGRQPSRAVSRPFESVALLAEPSDASPERVFGYRSAVVGAQLPAGVDRYTGPVFAVDYVATLVGAADVASPQQPCAAQPDTSARPLRVLRGAEYDPRTTDVHLCLYKRANGLFQLVRDLRPNLLGTGDVDFLRSVRFALCPADALDGPACVAMNDDGGGVARWSFRLPQKVASRLALRVRALEGGALEVDASSSRLPVRAVVAVPRLPPAVDDAQPLAFSRFDVSEWRESESALCLFGDWIAQLPAGALDASAPLVLATGATRTQIGSGRWIAANGQLCPELNDKDVEQIVRAARTAIFDGDAVQISFVQNGAPVGVTRKLTGPAQPPLARFEFRTDIGGRGVRVGAFPPIGPFAQPHSICAATQGDWGDHLRLDPRQLSLRSTDGTILASLEPTGPTTRVRFDRIDGGAPGETLYCASLVGGAPMHLVSHGSPAADATRVSLLLDGAGCTADEKTHLCENLPIASGFFLSTLHLDPWSFELRESLAGARLALGWGKVWAAPWVAHRPSFETRVSAQMPVVVAGARWGGLVTASWDLGASLGLGFSADAVDGTLQSRWSVPLGLYSGACLSITPAAKVLFAVPQLCGSVGLDMVSLRSTRTAEKVAPVYAAEGFGSVGAFVSLGFGPW